METHERERGEFGGGKAQVAAKSRSEKVVGQQGDTLLALLVLKHLL